MKKYSGTSLVLSIIFSKLLLGSSVDSLKKNIQKIESEIKEKNIRIQNIDTEKTDLEKKILSNEKEIAEIKKERDRIQEEIRIVLRKIDYNKKSYTLTEGELERIKKENSIKIQSWNRYSIEKESGEISSENILSFKKILNRDTTRIEKVENIKGNILQSQKNVERQKIELQTLQNRAIENRKKLDKRISEQEALIKRLNVERQSHQSRIKKLGEEKARIQKEIEKIIAARSKVNNSVNLTTAKKTLGKLARPLKGTIVTKFKKMKNGVSSNGIEIRSNLGALVLAAAGGKVIYSDEFQGLGKVVMVDYGSNLIGVYGNLISTNVKMGKLVKKGENIGVLGLSNDGTPDLYYEVRFKLKTVNPEEFF